MSKIMNKLCYELLKEVVEIPGVCLESRREGTLHHFKHSISPKVIISYLASHEIFEDPGAIEALAAFDVLERFHSFLYGSLTMVNHNELVYTAFTGDADEFLQLLRPPRLTRGKYTFNPEPYRKGCERAEELIRRLVFKREGRC